jgi:hypothetical protein
VDACFDSFSLQLEGGGVDSFPVRIAEDIMVLSVKDMIAVVFGEDDVPGSAFVFFLDSKRVRKDEGRTVMLTFDDNETSKTRIRRQQIFVVLFG